MANENAAGFLGRIRQVLPDLHPAERRLGDFLLDFPGELSSYDAQELATLAHVSKATVSRFVRRIGFASFEQARKAAREDGRTAPRPMSARTQARGFPDPGVNAAQESLDWTFRRIAPEHLEAVAGALVEARRVWIVGRRISQSFATYLYWQLSGVLTDIAVIPRDGETLGEHVASIRPEDCVLVFGLGGRPAGALPGALLGELLRTGARLAYVTDEAVAPRSDLDWHFVCQTSIAGSRANHAAVLALCHQIAVRATRRAGPSGRDRLRRVEDCNGRLSQA